MYPPPVKAESLFVPEWRGWDAAFYKTVPPFQWNHIAQPTFLKQSKAIEDIERVLPCLDDSDMEELFQRVIGKLQSMTDKEFEQLELAEAE